MIKNWNVEEIKREIDKIAWAECDNRMDGYVTWTCKKELYDLLWYVEDKISKCSTYAGEEDFIKDRNFQKMWDALKGD